MSNKKASYLSMHLSKDMWKRRPVLKTSFMIGRKLGAACMLGNTDLHQESMVFGWNPDRQIFTYAECFDLTEAYNPEFAYMFVHHHYRVIKNVSNSRRKRG